MDRILIQDLQVKCIIGVNEDERLRKQDVVINLALMTDLGRAGRSDRFEDTLDYRAVKKEVMSLVERSQFFLIEALAEAVAGLCLKNPAVSAVTVRVDKPGALSSARSVAVEIERGGKV
jgi:D-erythro-7,8-dihydroneopterin triphosphate epimerase